jgi:cysteinyl-tRNA synthetase
MELIIDIRQMARKNKDWPTADKIRDSLQELEVVIKDSKEGTSWMLK